MPINNVDFNSLEVKEYLKRLDQVIYDIFSIVETHIETRTTNINKKLGSYYRDRLKRLEELLNENSWGKKIVKSNKKPRTDLVVLLEERDELILRKTKKDLSLILLEIQVLRNLPPNETETGVADEDLKNYLEGLIYAQNNNLGIGIASQYIIKKADGEYLYNNKPIVFHSKKTDYFKLFDSLYDITNGGGEVTYSELYREYRKHGGKKPKKGETADEIKHKISNLVTSFFSFVRVDGRKISRVNLGGRNFIEAITISGLRFNNKR